MQQVKKINQLLQPQENRVVGSSSCPSEGSTHSISKKSALCRVKSRIEMSSEPDKGQSSSYHIKESTPLNSKRGALYHVKSCVGKPTESDEDQSNDTSDELRKTNELLAKLISQVSKTQRRVAALEEKLVASVSSSTSSGSSRKRSKSVDVPKVVRVSLVIR